VRFARSTLATARRSSASHIHDGGWWVGKQGCSKQLGTWQITQGTQASPYHAALGGMMVYMGA
jgi:hypothetical protein